MRLKQLCVYVVGVCMAFAMISCGSSEIVQNLTAEERFEIGKQKFEKGDYLEAIQDFQAITTQYPGSAVADDAQYYLGECYFQRQEFRLAANEFEMLRKNMPASSFLPMASYKIGLCYYNLSPKSPLDQNFTKKAIDEFQTFVEYFPTHELVPDAEAKIQELNNKLAKKDYDTAILYMKMDNYKSATLYFDSVLEKYHDSEFAERAAVGKIQCLVNRKKYEDAQIEIEKFRSKYPNSQYKDEINRLENFITGQVKDHSAVENTVTPLPHAGRFGQ